MVRCPDEESNNIDVVEAVVKRLLSAEHVHLVIYHNSYRKKVLDM